MTRITLQTLETAPAESRPGLETALKNSGFLPNLLGVLSNAPIALEAYQTLTAITARGTLTPQEREVVQLVAATTHGCTFCVAGHTALSRNKVKLPEPVLQALRDRDIDVIEDPRLLALARFTSQVIATRARVPDAQLRNFLAAGFTEGQALEVITGVGLATICNFANNLAQTPVNPELQAYAWDAQ